MSQITGVINSSFASGKKLLGRKKKDMDQLSGEHAYQDPHTGQWLTTSAASSTSVVSTQTGYGPQQSYSGSSAVMTGSGFGQYPTNVTSGYPISSTPVAAYGGSVQEYYGGQTPIAHQYESSPYSYTPSTASGPQGSYDPNASPGPHYTPQQPPPVDPYYQYQHASPPAQTEQYAQPPPPVPYNQYTQSLPPVSYNQYGQPPPPPAGYPSQQHPSSGYGGNGY